MTALCVCVFLLLFCRLRELQVALNIRVYIYILAHRKYANYLSRTKCSRSFLRALVVCLREAALILPGSGLVTQKKKIQTSTSICIIRITNTMENSE